MSTIKAGPFEIVTFSMLFCWGILKWYQKIIKGINTMYLSRKSEKHAQWKLKSTSLRHIKYKPIDFFNYVMNLLWPVLNCVMHLLWPCEIQFTVRLSGGKYNFQHCIFLILRVPLQSYKWSDGCHKQYEIWNIYLSFIEYPK